ISNKMTPVLTQPREIFISSAEADWASGICDCCEDTKQCCFACWCCPCFACKTTKEFGQCLCLPVLDVFGCIRPITMSIRVSIRQRYGIKGNLCIDCLCSTFCVPCVWCQMATEMKKQKLPTMFGDIISL
uniref:Plac8 onzin related protein 2 n=1 Tax=Amphilophus citrinellus TaxID=61819 RepID=A0A3Q0RNF7_AMPCI